MSNHLFTFECLWKQKLTYFWNIINYTQVQNKKSVLLVVYIYFYGFVSTHTKFNFITVLTL